MKKISKLILLVSIFLATACTRESQPHPRFLGKLLDKSTSENGSQNLYWRSGVFVFNGKLVTKSSPYYLVYNFACEDGRLIVNLVDVTVE